MARPMRLPTLLLFVLTSYVLQAQTAAVGGEWFIDDDPGYNQATAFATPDPGENVELMVQFPTTGLSPGLHTYNARVRDEEGRWSQTHSRVFQIVAPRTTGGLMAIEWFWGDDPGFGAGTQLPVSGDTASARFTLDVSDLSPGRHALTVRAQNTDGRWGPAVRRSTSVRAHPEALIDRLTYSYVTGGGDSSATFTYLLPEPQHYVDVSFTPDTTDLIGGQSYDFCVSAVRTDDQVSTARCRTFLYTEPTTSLNEPIGAPLGIFPNPNDGTFRLQLPTDTFAPGHFQVVDGTGRIVHNVSLAVGDKAAVDISLPDLVSGVYFAVLAIEGRVHVQRIVIQ